MNLRFQHAPDSPTSLWFILGVLLDDTCMLHWNMYWYTMSSLLFAFSSGNIKYACIIQWNSLYERSGMNVNHLDVQRSSTLCDTLANLGVYSVHSIFYIFVFVQIKHIYDYGSHSCIFFFSKQMHYLHAFTACLHYASNITLVHFAFYW